MNRTEALARLAYTAYGRHRQWTTVDGKLMPAWSQQREDIQAAWMQAALAVEMAVAAGVSEDEGDDDGGLQV